MENEDNKVSMVEMVLWLLLFTIPVDAISAILDTTGVGAAIMPFFQGGMMFVMRAWFYSSKHDADAMKINGKQLTRLVSNLLPWIPTVTIVFLIDAYMHNHPNKAVQFASAAASGKINTGKIASVREAKGTVAAMREARSQYRATTADSDDGEGRGTGTRVSAPKLRYIAGSGDTRKEKVEPGEELPVELKKAA